MELKDHPCLIFRLWRIAVFKHEWDHGEIIYSDDACAVERYTCKHCEETDERVYGRH